MDWQDVMIERHGEGWAYKEYKSVDVYRMAEEIADLLKTIDEFRQANIERIEKENKDQ